MPGKEPFPRLATACLEAQRRSQAGSLGLRTRSDRQLPTDTPKTLGSQTCAQPCCGLQARLCLSAEHCDLAQHQQLPTAVAMLGRQSSRGLPPSHKKRNMSGAVGGLRCLDVLLLLESPG